MAASKPAKLRNWTALAVVMGLAATLLSALSYSQEHGNMSPPGGGGVNTYGGLPIAWLQFTSSDSNQPFRDPRFLADSFIADLLFWCGTAFLLVGIFAWRRLVVFA